MIWVVNAKWIGDYRVFVEFSDGVDGTIDFREKLCSDHRQIVRDLLDIEIFKTVKVDYDTLRLPPVSPTTFFLPDLYFDADL